MKKKILIIVSVVLLTAMATTSCSLFHTHSFGEWNTTKEPTCLDSGTQERYCECGEKQVETLSAKGHTEEEGMCIVCNKIFDPYKALIRIIKTQGTASDSSNSYSFPQNAYETSTSKTFLSYDADKNELQVIYATKEILLSFNIDPAETEQDIVMLCTLGEKTYVSTGTIYTNTFDMDTSTAHSFSTTAPSYLYSNMNSLLTISTKLALESTKEILKQTNMDDITMQAIGFAKIQ